MKNFVLLFAFSLFLGVCLAHAGQQSPNGGEASNETMINTPASPSQPDSVGSLSAPTPGPERSPNPDGLYGGGNSLSPNWGTAGNSPFQKAPRNYLEKW